jgi:hypothetical protein
MKSVSAYRHCILVSLALLIPIAAFAQTVEVGTCTPNLPTYSTISQAVSAVAAGATILVCPGTYPEQVTITQPLTLRGVHSQNAANPTITVPSGGLTQSYNGIYYQVLAQGTAAGLVNISNIAVNGSNNGVTSSTLAGVYYENASGEIARMAIYDQTGSGNGIPILVINPSSMPTTVEGNSIHDFDGVGISATGEMTIKSNQIIASNSFTGVPAPNGIVLYTTGTIADNLVITHPQPSGISTETGIEVQANDASVIGNTVVEFTIGIWLLGNSNQVKSNTALRVGGAVVVDGDDNDIELNVLTNSEGAEGISLGCKVSGNTIIKNEINDAYYGIVGTQGGNVFTPNFYSNINVVTIPCS